MYDGKEDAPLSIFPPEKEHSTSPITAVGVFIRRTANFPTKDVQNSFVFALSFHHLFCSRPAKITQARNGNRCCSPPIGCCAVKG
ncbi:hypothetical protein CDAR_603681 [Caerostris darwini]|uniref:Uncharacterized protein n=1 Tax=Caerostris darwini TaxID=1538125 RepID=A0AAV4TB13_9ARAC|nr:hypothetical protein CDAR_603681 [Caerostris darwini]